LKAQVRTIVRAPGRTDVRRWQDAGRLDVRAIPAMRAGRRSVFKKKRKTLSVNSAVSLVVDLSPSMGDRIKSATGLAVHLGDALKAAGVPFEIVGFRGGDCAYAIKTFSENWDKKALSHCGNMLMNLGGGTNITSAITSAAGRLRKVANVNRRIMLVLTDGRCGSGSFAVRAAGAYAKTVGVEVAGIGIGCDVSDAFAIAQNVYKIRDLGSTGLDVLVNRLGSA